MDPVWIAVLGAIVAVGVGVPCLAFRHDRFGAVLIAVIAVIAGVVTFDAIAISTDFHDADGFIDCWPGCSGWQEFVRWTFWPGSLLWLLLALVALGRWLTSKARSSAEDEKRLNRS